MMGEETWNEGNILNRGSLEDYIRNNLRGNKATGRLFNYGSSSELGGEGPWLELRNLKLSGIRVSGNRNGACDFTAVIKGDDAHWRIGGFAGQRGILSDATQGFGELKVIQSGTAEGSAYMGKDLDDDLVSPSGVSFGVMLDCDTRTAYTGLIQADMSVVAEIDYPGNIVLRNMRIVLDEDFRSVLENCLNGDFNAPGTTERSTIIPPSLLKKHESVSEQPEEKFDKVEDCEPVRKRPRRRRMLRKVMETISPASNRPLDKVRGDRNPGKDFIEGTGDDCCGMAEDTSDSAGVAPEEGFYIIELNGESFPIRCDLQAAERMLDGLRTRYPDARLLNQKA